MNFKVYTCGPYSERPEARAEFEMYDFEPYCRNTALRFYSCVHIFVISARTGDIVFSCRGTLPEGAKASDIRKST